MRNFAEQNKRMFRNYFNKLILFLLLILSNIVQSQAYTISQLDSLTYALKKVGKIDEVVQFNLKTVENYKKTNNSEGVTTAYLNIANALCILNKYKEGLYYLEKAEKEIENNENPALRSRLFNEYGRYYYDLDLYKESLKYFNRSIKNTENVSSPKQKNRLLYYSYAWKRINFEKLNQLDSMYKMRSRCLALGAEPMLYIDVATMMLNRKKNLDSVKFYLDKAMPEIDKYPLYQKALALLMYGKLHTEKKEYQQALSYYLQSLAVSKQTHSRVDVRTEYKLISETYKILNNKEKSIEYLEKYSALNDSINISEEDALNIPLEKAVNENEKEENKEKNHLYILISLIIFGFLIVGYFIYKANKEKQKIKDELISKKSQETEKLKKQINTSFDEVVQLAKKGDPFFLSRFTEVYPEFINNLSSRYPQLNTNDLRFSALLRLNLSNKEIMQYENLSIRTVETKKYRLRKKLDLPTDIDLNKWLMEL